MNYDDSRKARSGESTGHGHIAMQAVRKKKKTKVVVAICAVKRVRWRGTANPEVTEDNPVLEAVNRTKQVGQEQRSKDASSVDKLDIMQGSASRGGQNSSVVVLQLH